MTPIIGRGSKRDPDSLELFTRTRVFIPNEQRLEGSPAIMKTAIDVLRASFPTARLRSASQRYNCVGMIFASRRTWIDPEELEMIFREDGFRIVNDIKDVFAGDIVVYGNPKTQQPEHIGLILDKAANLRDSTWDVKVLSQWGRDGEYVHEINSLPTLLGEVLSFWTDRVVL